MDIQTEVAKRLRNHLSSVQHEQFDLYLRRLLEDRRSANLTSLDDPELIQRRLFLESIALLEALEKAGALASPVIDMGTGAGIPGLPFKIVRPELEMTLVEANGKKARFVKETVEDLGLAGVFVIQARAEELAQEQDQRAAYALALARAVAPLRILVELALPFVRTGGFLAAPKGSAAAREIREAENALALCRGAVERSEPLDVPSPGPAPTLVLVRKIGETPGRYPRRAGIPRKRPL